MNRTMLQRLTALLCVLLCLVLVCVACNDDTPNDGEKTPCTTHNDTDGDKKCDTCGADMPDDGNGDGGNGGTQTPTYTYKVTVTDAAGDPLTGAYVQFCIGEVCLTPDPVDENGVAMVNHETADYTVKVTCNGYDMQEVTFEQGSNEATVVLIPTPGTVLNPIWFMGDEVNTIELKRNRTVYYTGRLAGATMHFVGNDVQVEYMGETYTVTGELTLVMPEVGSHEMPPVFKITNKSSSTTPATYTVTFTYPEGTQQNPKALVLGTNSCEAVDGNGYYYTWIATAAGTLTVTVDEACTDWTYTVSNITKSVYGYNNASTDATPVTTTTVAVSEGDEIRIAVGTASFEDGTITFTAALSAE